jgi:serine/threonine-protein kinase
MWGSTDAICEELLGQADEETLDRTILVDDRETSTAYNPNRNNIDQFKQYLAFQGRGIPRRILRSFNQYVRSHDNELALVFNRRDMRRIRFYAQLQALLVREDNRLIRYIHDEARGERRDKRMLGIYYLIDWILQQGDRPFTLAEAHAAVGRLNARIAPDSRVDEDIAQIAVALLLDYEYLEQDSPTSLPQFAKQSPAQIARYRIARRRLLEIGFEGNDIDTPFTSTVDGGRVFHLEQYQILEHFARGGFADIYRARHTVTAEEVAIKVPSATGNFSVIRRQFLHEIRLLQGVEHVHIIKLIEAGETNEKPYYVMPFIDGIMMSDIIQMQQRGNLDLLLTIIRPIVAAHSYLHQRNIVRTDVKPSNIMIDHAGHVWLIDLGIAIDKNNLDADIPISGTPRYAAPEQWESADIDARVDIFGLGVVMYEFLTGNVPFETTKMSSAKFSPIPDSHYFQLDPSIRGIIQRCLSIDAQARFADASELLKVLPSNEDVNLQASIAEVEAYQKQAEQYEDENTEGFFTQLYNPEESKQSIEPPEHVPAVSDEEHTMRPLLPVEEYSKTILRKAVRASKETYPTLYEGDPLVHDGPVLRFDDPQITVDAEVRDQYGLFYPLTSDKTVRIGRSLENDISVDNKKVSRYQAMIYWKSDAFIIEDANSYECTRLNSDVIDKPTRLSDGNEIKIDKHTLTYWAKRTNPPTIIN